LEVILDTNALSAIADAEPRAVAAFSQAQSIAIPVAWISHVLRTFRELDVGVETAARYSQVRMELKRAGLRRVAW
jgi:predicted nucleic acid-binding protein